MVKWSSEKDAFILNALLLHPDVKINNPVIDTMITSWPEAFGEKPTRKAITEHFSKIRKNNKEFAPSGGPILTTPAATPRKPKAGNGGVRKTPASKRSKRTKNTASESDDEDGDEETNSARLVKRESDETDGLEESPSKRARRGSGKVKYEESDVEEHPSDLEAEDEYKEALEI